ncbi:MAG: PLP-dependent aminotransferase family protein, partial [Mesorhizobium sp.]
NRIRIAHRLVVGAMPGLLFEASSQMVLSGKAHEIGAASIAEVRHRIGMVRDALAGYDFNSHPNIPFVWLAMNGNWTSGAFRSAALAHNLLLDDEDEFKVGRSDRVFHRVRFAISARVERDGVARGLSIIRGLLDEGRVGGEWSD